VGTMLMRAMANPPVAVHPHGRGDNWVPGYDYLCYYGSPPRAWGQC